MDPEFVGVARGSTGGESRTTEAPLGGTSTADSDRGVAEAGDEGGVEAGAEAEGDGEDDDEADDARAGCGGGGERFGIMEDLGDVVMWHTFKRSTETV